MPLPSGSRTSRTATSGRSAGILRQRLRHRSGFADDVEFGIGAQQVDQSAAHDFVVVDQEDLHHGPTSSQDARDNGRADRQIKTEQSVMSSAMQPVGPTQFLDAHGVACTHHASWIDSPCSAR